MTDITDPKQFKELLSIIQQLKKENQQKAPKTPADSKKHMHVHRNSTVVQEEKDNVKFLAENFNLHHKHTTSEEFVSQTLKKLVQLGAKGKTVLDKLNQRFKTNEIGTETKHETILSIRGRNYSKPPVKYDDNIDNIKRRKRELIISNTIENLNKHDEENDVGIEEVSKIILQIFFTFLRVLFQMK